MPTTLIVDTDGTSAEAMTEVGGAVIHRDGRVEYPAQES